MHFLRNLRQLRRQFQVFSRETLDNFLWRVTVASHQLRNKSPLEVFLILLDQCAPVSNRDPDFFHECILVRREVFPWRAVIAGWTLQGRDDLFDCRQRSLAILVDRSIDLVKHRHRQKQLLILRYLHLLLLSGFCLRSSLQRPDCLQGRSLHSAYSIRSWRLRSRAMILTW